MPAFTNSIQLCLDCWGRQFSLLVSFPPPLYAWVAGMAWATPTQLPACLSTAAASPSTTCFSLPSLCYYICLMISGAAARFEPHAHVACWPWLCDFVTTAEKNDERKRLVPISCLCRHGTWTLVWDLDTSPACVSLHACTFLSQVVLVPFCTHPLCFSSTSILHEDKKGRRKEGGRNRQNRQGILCPFSFLDWDDTACVLLLQWVCYLLQYS